jgi:hypothetical protein
MESDATKAGTFDGWKIDPADHVRCVKRLARGRTGLGPRAAAPPTQPSGIRKGTLAAPSAIAYVATGRNAGPPPRVRTSEAGSS